jgi:(1->4)-alpha-D-glucan 1-alpha-D-glucosylmutase
MLKATREAKLRTSWTDPDPEFEEAVAGYVTAVLDPVRGVAVLQEVSRLVGRVGRPGLWGSLARSVLQLTSPGIPDLYQGDELWSFTLVDPDNRRPVDFAARRTALAAVTEGPDGSSADERIRDMVASPEDGRIKLHVVRSMLAARRAVPALRDGGEYAPLLAEGARGPNVVAFHRRSGGSRAVVAVPRLVATECGVEPPTAAFWGETTLAGLPGERWTCALTGRAVMTPGGRARLADVMPLIPAALLVGRDD